MAVFKHQLEVTTPGLLVSIIFCNYISLFLCSVFSGWDMIYPIYIWNPPNPQQQQQ